MSNGVRTALTALGLACFLALPFIPSAFGQSAPPTGGTATVTAVDTTNGLSLSNGTVSLAAAGAAQNGAVTTGTQTIAGDKTLTGVLLSSAGTATAPGIAWSADSDGTGTGFYRSAANEVSIALNGVRAVRIQGSSPCIYGDTNSSFVCLNSSVGSQLRYIDNAVTVDSANVTVSGVSLRTTLGVRLNTSGGGSKPTCDSSIRGMVWYVQGGAGVADTVEICAKAAADTYAWRSMATIP